MSELVIIENGELRKLLNADTIVAPASDDMPERKIPYHALAVWSAQERAAVNVYEIEDDPVPEGRQIVSSSLVFEDGRVRRKHVVEDIPPRPIALEIFCRRVKTEGLFEALSDHMIANAARRRMWDEMRIMRDPISPSSVPARNILTAIGATQPQIDRIMAG